MTLKGKTVIITGASRGIGLAIALRYAAAKANIVVVTKDSLDTIQKTSDQIISAGGKALTLNIDVSDHNAIKQAVSQAADQFGGIDALINNTSATCFTDTLHTLPEQFDLVISTSVRGAFFMSQTCLPHLKNAPNPHIINVSPPFTYEFALV